MEVLGEFFMVYDIDMHELNLGPLRNLKFFDEISFKKLSFLHFCTIKMKLKHIMVFPFGVSHCIVFQGCACLSVSHFKLLKYFYNIFTYYFRI
jgi:hypothetical protein